MTKYSLIIPTRNRQSTAVFAIQTAVDCIGEDKEVIVVDNSDDRSLKSLLESQGLLTHVKYIEAPSILSMKENWELGLDKSTGDYVGFMGDDDGVSTYALCALDEFILKAEPDVIHCRSSTYNWPGSIFPGISNALYVPKDLAGAKLIHNPRTLIEEIYKFNWNMGTGYGVYHGFVKRSLIERVRKIHGTYFFHESPDLASGYSSLLHAEKILSVNYPLFVSGHSPASNSGSLRTYAKYSKAVQKFKAESGDDSYSFLDYPKTNVSYLVDAHLNFVPFLEEFLQKKLDINYLNAFKMIADDALSGHESMHRQEIQNSLISLAERWNISELVEIPSAFRLTSGKQMQIGISRGGDKLDHKFAYDLSHLNVKSIVGVIKFLRTFLPIPSCSKSKDIAVVSEGIRTWSAKLVENGDYQVAIGDLNQAISSYREYLELINYDEAVYEKLGDILCDANRIDEAIFCFARSFTLNARITTFEKYVAALLLNSQLDIAKELLDTTRNRGNFVLPDNVKSKFATEIQLLQAEVGKVIK